MSTPTTAPYAAARPWSVSLEPKKTPRTAPSRRRARLRQLGRGPDGLPTPVFARLAVGASSPRAVGRRVVAAVVLGAEGRHPGARVAVTARKLLRPSWKPATQRPPIEEDDDEDDAAGRGVLEGCAAFTRRQIARGLRRRIGAAAAICGTLWHEQRERAGKPKMMING